MALQKMPVACDVSKPSIEMKTGITKTAGSSEISITGLANKPVGFMVRKDSTEIFWIWNAYTGKLEYYSNGSHNSSYDVSCTVTFGDDSITTSNVNLSNSAITLICYSIYI